ncbi:hypothetical protein PR048_003611 [Dryococelus australis]|uniref:Uncharacterized protein n=1 Tax=Dryococelus australis TaxID=614101 RepID=A0ABQ9IPJ5_9NEOP|nr:hypothetical protein PR048_003611 [Dryococelus australis]
MTTAWEDKGLGLYFPGAERSSLNDDKSAALQGITAQCSTLRVFLVAHLICGVVYASLTWVVYLSIDEYAARCSLAAKKMINAGAAVSERLACSPPTIANQVQSLAGSPDFRMWESCRTMPLVGRFSQGYPVSPALSFRRCSILT